jgi:hypothetical protein
MNEAEPEALFAYLIDELAKRNLAYLHWWNPVWWAAKLRPSIRARMR